MTVPGPNPIGTADVVVWEWEPVARTLGLRRIGRDRVMWLAPMTYGANVAVATLE